MCWVHTHTYKHSMKKREHRKRIQHLVPTDLIKGSVGEPVDQLGLAALGVPHHHHRQPRHLHLHLPMIFLEFLNRNQCIFNRRVLQLNNFNSWIHTAGLLWNTLIIQRLYKLLEQSLFLLTIGNSLNCCLLSPLNSRLLHFSGASTSPLESNPQLGAGGTGWGL